MQNNSICFCRECGARLSFSGKSIAAHYEKAHLSSWLANRELFERIPKAFVEDSATQSIPSSQSKASTSDRRIKVDPTADKHRAANASRFASILENVHSGYVQPYREHKFYQCPCCLRTLSSGKRILFDNSSKNFTICYECYSAARKKIKIKRKPKLEYYPVGGMTSWQKR